ncbi:MAG: hypothetical protein JWN15_1849 [Firmicutes bacterium]|nr:hypothetical protein [Bacillota bacterium]
MVTVKEDIVEALQDIMRDHADELRRLEYGDILIKIQDGRPVFMDITAKHKLK